MKVNNKKGLIKMNYEIFRENYEKWEKQAWEEFKNGEFYNGEEREDIEICEDGTVYLNLFSYIKNCVTSWEDSEFFIK
jgi:regulator of RNase E activity RraB